MKAVLRSEPPVKRAGWTARLLDGLGGLGGWLAGPDPGLNRLRTVAGATLTIAGAIGAEWLFVHDLRPAHRRRGDARPRAAEDPGRPDQGSSAACGSQPRPPL